MGPMDLRKIITNYNETFIEISNGTKQTSISIIYLIEDNQRLKNTIKA